MFAISKLLHDNASKEFQAVYYKNSESKTELFLNSLEKLSTDNSLGHDLEDFLNIYNVKIYEFSNLNNLTFLNVIG